MKTGNLIVHAMLAGAAIADASPRTSASYAIPTDTTDSGGHRTTSASYTNDGSVGGIVGISTVAAPEETAKHGYIGQLFEVTGLTLTAGSLDVNEGATDQLAAWQALDDATFLAVPAASVAWSVQSGPLTGISAGGLATAGIVYQDTAATVQGIFAGDTGMLTLTVKNVNLDDFGAYAGDVIDDSWQVQYFGLPPNPNAGPTVDFSGTGQTNLFKFVAGLNPLDANSRFVLKIESVPNQPGQKNLIFSPRFPDRTYTVKAKPDLLTGAFLPLGSLSFADDGDKRTVTDLDASGVAKFYHIEITKP